MTSVMCEQPSDTATLARIHEPNGPYLACSREILASTTSVPVGELSIAPPPYVSRTISAQRS